MTQPVKEHSDDAHVLVYRDAATKRWGWQCWTCLSDSGPKFRGMTEVGRRAAQHHLDHTLVAEPVGGDQ